MTEDHHRGGGPNSADLAAYAWPVTFLAGVTTQEAAHGAEAIARLGYSVTQLRRGADVGRTLEGTTTLAEGPPRSVVTHSAEPLEDPMSSTPAQKRDAWLALVQHLERSLIATRENAKASRSMAQAIVDDTGHAQEGRTPPDWDATAWAAQRLLDAITALTAPEVPRDDETGQGDILQELQPVHFVGPLGGLHAVRSMEGFQGTDKPGETTCRACLELLTASQLYSTPGENPVEKPFPRTPGAW